MNPLKPQEIKPIEQFHTRLYNELESHNLRKFHKDSSSVFKLNSRVEVLKFKASSWPSKAKLLEVINTNEKNQFTIFQKTMVLLLFCGQCLGLNPVVGITERDPCKLRFRIFSFRFLYGTIVFSGQAIATVLCILRMVYSVDISKVAFASFYLSTCLTTFLFMRVAVKWPALMQAVHKSGLNEYVDPHIKFKVTVATVILLTLALMEHILSFISRYANVLRCYTDETEIYQLCNENQFPWFYDVGIPYSLPIGILLQIQSVISAMNWNYSDLFIVCISMYLSSILHKIKQKLIRSKDQNSPSQWRSLREDYTRATRLIRTFDDVISGVTLSSFATNLFFICLQLFYVLSIGVTSQQLETQKTCSNSHSGPFGGYERLIYFSFSVSFILGRSVVVSLIAAGVHAESLEFAPPLYDVSGSAYCEEVQRFIEQVHWDNVALSGHHFFYVTRELVLSVAATVLTYELVLLQFSGW